MSWDLSRTFLPKTWPTGKNLVKKMSMEKIAGKIVVSRHEAIIYHPQLHILHVSSEQRAPGGCLGHIGDYTTHVMW